MNKKLIFRIIGAIASALIIVSVFVPFVSVTGYSSSLWQTYKSLDTLYLPIMLIVFGAIGVIFFALNIKTEFAYMSVGAVLFFVVMQTIDVLDQDIFNTLSLGYYFLVAGAILTGVMAFLCNLKSKVYKDENISNEVIEKQPSMIDQIDKLYNDQTQDQNLVQPLQVVNNIEPLPVQPIQTTNNETTIPVQPVIQPQMISQSITNVEPVIEPQVNIESNDIGTGNIITPQQVAQPFENNNIESINAEKTPTLVNPLVEESNNVVPQSNPSVEAVSNATPQSNPVVAEFDNVAPQSNPSVEAVSNATPQSNPVISEFSNVTSQSSVQPMIEQQNNFSVPLQSINNISNSDSSTNFNNVNTQGGTDIFGQPINK